MESVCSVPQLFVLLCLRLIGIFHEISAGSTRVAVIVSTDGLIRLMFIGFGSIFCRSCVIFHCAKRSSSLLSFVPSPIFGRVTPIISDYRRISSHDFRNTTEFTVRLITTEFVFYVFLMIFFSQHSCYSSPSTESTFTSAKSPNSVLPGALPPAGIRPSDIVDALSSSDVQSTLLFGHSSLARPDPEPPFSSGSSLLDNSSVLGPTSRR